jgi:hypothetical protein
MSKEPQSNAADYARVTQIFKLLKQTSSIGVISGYLKSKGLVHSASSWDELFTKRIEPAFLKNEISLEELLELLRNAEESGRQHVFLYKCKQTTAVELLDRQKVRKALVAKQMAGLLGSPLLLDLEDISKAQIVDVRWTTTNKGVDVSMTVKIVAHRHVNELSSTVTNADGSILKLFTPVKRRVVHVFRLHRDGTLEVRIASHATSTRYEEDLRHLRDMVEFLIPAANFKPISLTKAKERLWVDWEALSDRVRFVDSTLKNDEGYMLRGISSSEGGNIKSNSATTESLEMFRKSDGYCDAQNIYFLPCGEPPKPSKQTHVILGGAIHEFAVPANCSHIDYEHVFDEIRTLNA